MTERIEADLFARLMDLPRSARNDLLEFLGETPLADAELERLIDALSAQDSPPGSPLPIRPA